MKNLEKNIINLYGKNGEVWLEKLPLIINELSNTWGLSDLQPVNNMSFNYVAKALQKNDIAVIIKVACKASMIKDEIKALKHFHGSGCVKLLDVNNKQHALLLAQADPGTTLLTEDSVESVIDAYCSLIRALHTADHAPHNFDSIKKWLEAIDRVKYSKISSELLNKAIGLKKHLLETSENEIILHGDLHLDNILLNDNNWIAIDPKGIIGEPTFDVFPHDLINNKNDIRSIIALIAENLDLDSRRIMQWIFVRLILMAAWMIEDSANPTDALNKAKIIYNLL